MADYVRAIASEIGLCRVSPFAVWCNHHVDPIHQDKDRTLAVRGLEHEDVVTTKMSEGLVMETKTVKTRTESFRAGLEDMQKGVGQLRGVCLFGGGVCGIPDLLVRVEKHSLFGNHSYVPYEIKSSTIITPQHVWQGASYSYMLGIIQGHAPDFVIVNGNGDERERPYDQYADQMQEFIDQVHDLANGTVIPEPIYGHTPRPWRQYGDQMAIKSGDISLVNGIGPVKRQMLADIGVQTIGDLARLETPPNGITARHVSCAAALSSGREVRLCDISLPENPTFIDLEGVAGDPDGDFLIGTMYGGKYVPFLAESRDGQRKMILDFIDWCGSHDGMLCHWAPYDRVHLENVATKCGIDMDGIIARCHDLWNTVRNSYAFPIPNYKLKDLSRYCGHEWRSEIDGMMASGYYNAYLEGNQDALDALLQYNEEDCLATERVYRYVQALG